MINYSIHISLFKHIKGEGPGIDCVPGGFAAQLRWQFPSHESKIRG
jgi:hypothetical protein